jgi:hypothetical protein
MRRLHQSKPAPLDCLPAYVPSDRENGHLTYMEWSDGILANPSVSLILIGDGRNG